MGDKKTVRLGRNNSSRKTRKSEYKSGNKSGNKSGSQILIGKDNYSGGKEHIPEYKIEDGPAFARVNFNLKKGQMIYANAGMMSYMDKSIAVKTETRGFLKGLVRAVLTTSSMFQTGYEATVDNTKLSFSSHLPGDITPLVIRPGDKYTLSSFSVVCMTSNIKIDTKMRLKGMFLGENAFLPQAYIDENSNENGIIWIASYGGVEKIDVPSGTTLSVDNGMFLAANSTTSFTVGKVGGIKSFFFSGEGLVMDFKGPCSLYVQGRNLNQFTQFIQSIAESVSGKGKGLGGTLGRLFD